MASINNFEDLKVWQKARLLCQEIFDLIEKRNFAEITNSKIKSTDHLVL